MGIKKLKQSVHVKVHYENGQTYTNKHVSCIVYNTENWLMISSNKGNFTTTEAVFVEVMTPEMHHKLKIQGKFIKDQYSAWSFPDAFILNIKYHSN